MLFTEGELVVVKHVHELRAEFHTFVQRFTGAEIVLPCGYRFTNKMSVRSGKLCKITKLEERGYRLDNDPDFIYTDEMLKKVEQSAENFEKYSRRIADENNSI